MILTPVAMLGFAIGAYLVNAEHDPWRRSLVGGALLAFAFIEISRLTLHIGSDVVAQVLVWSTLLLGSGGIGAWARISAR